MPTTDPTEALANLAAELSVARLPQTTTTRVAEIVADAVASALAGRSAEEVAKVEAASAATLGPGTASVLGGGELSQAGAALVNGYQVTAVTVCDIHRPTLCHVTPEVIPPALALAEERHLCGGDLLAAVAAGLETTVRVGAGLVYPSFRARGWHSPGVSGALGAAACAARALGSSPAEALDALGIAGSQAAGTFASYGTPTLKFHQGRGALSGLLAARLAEQGFGGPRDILTHPDGGLLTTYSDGGDPEAITDGLGERWDLETISLRRWPVASSIQPMVTALFHLLNSAHIEVGDIDEVAIDLPPAAYDMHAEMVWDDEFRAHLSAPYVTAVVLHDRACWMQQFTHRRSNPDVDAFARRRVRIARSPDLPETSAVVRLVSGGRAIRSRREDVPKGDPGNPLTGEEIREKFFDASAGVLPAATAERAWDALANLEAVDDMAPVVRLLRADGQRAAAPRA